MLAHLGRKVNLDMENVTQCLTLNETADHDIIISDVTFLFSIQVFIFMLYSNF